MIHVTVETRYVLAVIAAGLLSFYLHEGSHWFVGWLGDTDPKMQWVLWGIPMGVDHRKMEAMDPVLIQFSGASIFLWIPPGVLAWGYLLFDPSPGHLFVALLPLFVVLGTTESDVIAVRDPEKFRRLWANDEFDRGSVFNPFR